MNPALLYVAMEIDANTKQAMQDSKYMRILHILHNISLNIYISHLTHPHADIYTLIHMCSRKLYDGK